MNDSFFSSVIVCSENITLFYFQNDKWLYDNGIYDEDWLVWYFSGTMEDFSEKFDVVVLDRILFEITEWYYSGLNETSSLSEDWSDSVICIFF